MLPISTLVTSLRFCIYPFLSVENKPLLDRYMETILWNLPARHTAHFFIALLINSKRFSQVTRPDKTCKWTFCIMWELQVIDHQPTLVMKSADSPTYLKSTMKLPRFYLFFGFDENRSQIFMLFLTLSHNIFSFLSISKYLFHKVFLHQHRCQSKCIMMKTGRLIFVPRLRQIRLFFFFFFP